MGYTDNKKIHILIVKSKANKEEILISDTVLLEVFNLKKIIDEEKKKLLIEMYVYNNKTYEEIAKKLGCHKDTVYRYVKKNNLKRAFQDKSWLEYQHYKKGLNLKQISEITHTTPETIKNYFNKFGIKTNKEIVATSRRTYKANESFFESIDTEEKAYWLGFIVADGNVSKRKDRKESYRLTIKLNGDDENHLKKFLEAIESDVPIVMTTQERFGKQLKTAQVRINSSKMCKDLIELGVIPAKTGKETIPPIPEHLKKDFLRGLFDGDGSFSWRIPKDRVIPSSSVSMCGSLEICNFFNEMIVSLGVNAQAIQDKGTLHTVTLGGNFNVQKFMEWLYRGSTIMLDRKFENYQLFLKEINDEKYENAKLKSNVYHI